MFRDNLISVPRSSIDGKEENSRGFLMKKVKSKTLREKVIDNVSSKSNRKAGIGITIAERIRTTAKIIQSSLPFMKLRLSIL